LFPAEALDLPGFDPAYAVDFWDLTNRQDWNACESVQRGVSGRGYRQAPFTAAEADVAAFVAYVADAYLTGTPAGVTPEVARGR
jgi:glycine betaine catabolism A